MNRELLQKALDIIKKSRSGYGDDYHSEDERNVIAALEAELAKPEQDWDLLAKTQESLREHMARIKELEAELAKQKALDKKAENARELGLDYEVEQEPVACIVGGEVYLADEIDWEELGGTPLYAAPPRKPWVGLTITEREQIQQECFGKVFYHIAFSYAIEAKLKEKNI